MKRILGFLLLLLLAPLLTVHAAGGGKKKPGELPIGAWQEEKSGLSVRVAKKAGDMGGLAILSGDRMILVSGPPPRAGRADDVFAPDKFSTENGLVRATGIFNWDRSAQDKKPGPVELTIAFEDGAPVIEILRTGDYDRYAVGRHVMKRFSLEKPRDPKKGEAKPGEKSGSVITENESTSPAGTTTYRDKNGRITGTGTTSPAGTTTFRDPNGRITGNSSTSPAGTTTHRDDKGRITTSSDTTRGTGGDSTTYYRRNGVIVGQKYISPAGNITWRDGSGRIISGPNW
jgi:hypothetical protein